MPTFTPTPRVLLDVVGHDGSGFTATDASWSDDRKRVLNGRDHLAVTLSGQDGEVSVYGSEIRQLAEALLAFADAAERAQVGRAA